MNAMRLMAAAAVLSMTAFAGFADDEKSKASDPRVLKFEAGDVKVELTLQLSHQMQIRSQTATFDVKENMFTATGAVTIVVKDDQSTLFTLNAESVKILFVGAGHDTVKLTSKKGLSRTSLELFMLTGDVVITFPDRM
jgi:hypothetical protein